jgi:hypothetical protein
MSEPILILGKSGSGKSYACRNLDPKTTLLVSVDGKRYPFSMKEWGKMNKENLKGSLYVPTTTGSAAYTQIKKASDEAIKQGKKTIIIDDSQFLMANEFFKRAYESGWDKFTEMGASFHDMIVWGKSLPDDVTVYFLHHLELDSDGSIKVKTVGKMLDQQTSIEGKFTVCLLARKYEDNYELCQSVSNEPIIKAPPGMFEKDPMDNDIAEVDKSIREFWGI